MSQQYDPSLEPSIEMQQEAKRHPNGWVYVIQGNYGPDDAVPPEAIAGAWRVDGSGNIIKDSYVANPKFKGVPTTPAGA
jgi:uncharacterized protein (DUF2126 family)